MNRKIIIAVLAGYAINLIFPIQNLIGMGRSKSTGS